MKAVPGPSVVHQVTLPLDWVKLPNARYLSTFEQIVPDCPHGRLVDVIWTGSQPTKPELIVSTRTKEQLESPGYYPRHTVDGSVEDVTGQFASTPAALILHADPTSVLASAEKVHQRCHHIKLWLLNNTSDIWAWHYTSTIQPWHQTSNIWLWHNTNNY